MDTKQILELLSKIDLFREFPLLLLPNIASQVTSIKFKERDFILRQNQKIENFYILAQGRLEVYKKDQQGIQNHISYLLPRDYFGDFYLLSDQASKTEIIALEESECLCLSKTNFLDLLEIDLEISQHIIRSTLLHLHKTSIIEEIADYRTRILQLLEQKKKIGQHARLIGKSKINSDLNRPIEQMAKTDLSLLLEGEYGTGKELVSRIIHAKSSRAKKPFISVNCDKLPIETMASQILGQFSLNNNQRDYGTGFSYLELAEGGTLLLKNIENLPLDIQVRIQELSSARINSKQEKLKTVSNLPNVRIIATTCVNLQSKIKEGFFDKKLYHLLSVNKLLMLPLRERKRDIPDLAEYFIKKYSRQYQKKVDKVSPAAMKSLLAYDYKLSNVQELEEIIHRAINLTRSDTIRSEHLFLGLPAAKPLTLFNLLKLKTLVSCIKKKILPEQIRRLVAVFFVLMIISSLFFSQTSYNSYGKLLAWSIWWPAMFLSFFFVGRAWCSICPYATYSHLAKKIINKEFNFPFKKYDFLFMTSGFLFIVWIEEVSFMRGSSFKTGLLQLSIVILAIIMGMIYKRDSWCRFMCPLGALISISSMASIIEVRSNPDICLNQCTTHDCFKGTNNNPGCPMFQHLMYVDNNQTCKMCLACVRSCSHDNISLNIRPPGAEIYHSNQLNKGLFLFVIVLMGTLVPILLLHKHLLNNNLFLFTLLYIFIPFILFSVHWLVTKIGFKSEHVYHLDILGRIIYSYVPLMLTAHISYQIQFLPFLNTLVVSLQNTMPLAIKGIIFNLPLINI
ncbi:MAG: sigma 54-interacting transcriptional regulator, partial [bacterium]